MRITHPTLRFHQLTICAALALTSMARAQSSPDVPADDSTLTLGTVSITATAAGPLAARNVYSSVDILGAFVGVHDQLDHAGRRTDHLQRLRLHHRAGHCHTQRQHEPREHQPVQEVGVAKDVHGMPIIHAWLKPAGSPARRRRSP